MIYALFSGAGLLAVAFGRVGLKLFVGLALLPFLPFPFNLPLMLLI